MKDVMKKATALILSAMMTAGIFSYSMPKDETAVNAASTNKVLAFGENMKTILKTGANTENAPIVYFGYNSNFSTNLDWNVVGFDGTGVARSSNSGCATLLARHVMGQTEYAHFVPGTYSYLYSESLLKKYVQELAEKDTTAEEKKVMKERNNLGAFWPLDITEASVLDYSLRCIDYGNGASMPLVWSLRDQKYGTQNAYVMLNSEISIQNVDSPIFTRPAFNLDLSQVAYISSAKDVKYGKIGQLDPVSDYSENKWKLAIYDENYANFKVVYDWDPSNITAGDTLEVIYTCNRGARNCYITAVITDENDNVLRYGYIGTNISSGPSYGVEDLTIPSDLGAGKYKLKLFQRNVNGDYCTDTVSNIVDINITVKANIGNVTGLKAASAGKNQVKLTWNAVKGAEGYLVYAQKNKKYGYVGMTTSGTTFTDKKALDTDYNYYWVFAYVKDSTGKMITGGCEKYVYAKGVCLAVTNLKASSVSGGVKLTWTASSGAEGYLIYGIHPGGSYEYIGMTTQGTTFTDKKASKTDWNYYWVFPYHKNGSTMVVGGTAKYVYGKAK